MRMPGEGACFWPPLDEAMISKQQKRVIRVMPAVEACYYYSTPLIFLYPCMHTWHCWVGRENFDTSVYPYYPFYEVYSIRSVMCYSYVRFCCQQRPTAQTNNRVTLIEACFTYFS